MNKIINQFLHHAIVIFLTMLQAGNAAHKTMEQDVIKTLMSSDSSLQDKNWTNYMFEHLAWQLKADIPRAITLQLTFKIQEQSARKFLQLKDAKVKVPACCKQAFLLESFNHLLECVFRCYEVVVNDSHTEPAECFIDKNEKSLTQVILVSKASGKLWYNHSAGGFPGYLPTCYFHSLSWTFVTDLRLRINLTFTKLYFSTSTLQCLFGNLTIFQLPSSDNMFVFCNRHPLFNIYPEFQHFAVRLTTFKCTTSFISTYFAVQDAFLVTNILKKSGTKKKVRHLPIFYIRESYFLYNFLVHVPKFYVITFTKNSRVQSMFAMTVHNGPFAASPSLLFKQNHIISSTFQCLIKLLMQAKLLTLNSYLKFQSNLIQMDKQLDIKPNTSVLLSVPRLHHKSLWSLNASTNKQYQINTTVLDIMTGDFTNYDCTSTGLVTAEILNTGYKENPTFCQNFSNRIDQGRSTYSHTSALLLLLYWYPGLSAITVNLSVSTTDCKLIQFSKSRLQQLCFSDWPVTTPVYPLTGLFEGDEIQLFYDRLPSYRPTLNIHYLLNETTDACFILQFVETVQTCNLAILPRSLQHPAEIDITVKGFG